MKMRKVFRFACIIVCVLIQFGCSEDYSFENSEKMERLKRMKAKIEQTASDYNLNFTVDEALLSQNLDRINEDSVDAVFQRLASIKGKYTFGDTVQKNGRFVVNAIKRSSRKNMIVYNQEYHFNTVRKGTATCDCTLYYFRENDHITTIEAAVSITDSQDITYQLNDTVYAYESPAFSGNIVISGCVQVQYTVLGIISYNISGNYLDGGGGYIIVS